MVQRLYLLVLHQRDTPKGATPKQPHVLHVGCSVGHLLCPSIVAGCTIRGTATTAVDHVRHLARRNVLQWMATGGNLSLRCASLAHRQVNPMCGTPALTLYDPSTPSKSTREQARTTVSPLGAATTFMVGYSSSTSALLFQWSPEQGAGRGNERQFSEAPSFATRQNTHTHTHIHNIPGLNVLVTRPSTTALQEPSLTTKKVAVGKPWRVTISP